MDQSGPIIIEQSTSIESHTIIENSTKKWAKEKEELLLSLIKNGRTYNEIAKIFGVTKNTIIGKANRLKARYLAGEDRTRALNIKRRKEEERRALEEKRRAKNDGKWFYKVTPWGGIPTQYLVFDETLFTRKDRIGEPASKKVKLLDLQERMCRYPDIENDGGASFCGHDKKEGSSYCDFHHDCCTTKEKK